MPNNLTKILEETVESFFKEGGSFNVSCFRCALNGENPLRAAVITESKIKQILSPSYLAILEALKKEVEWMEAPADSEYDLEAVHEGYFLAIKDILALIKEAKEVIK